VLVVLVVPVLVSVVMVPLVVLVLVRSLFTGYPARPHLHKPGLGPTAQIWIAGLLRN
jgi:hypothetical protein